MDHAGVVRRPDHAGVERLTRYSTATQALRTGRRRRRLPTHRLSSSQNELILPARLGGNFVKKVFVLLRNF
jgi:hypothetical protein